MKKPVVPEMPVSAYKKNQKTLKQKPPLLSQSTRKGKTSKERNQKCNTIHNCSRVKHFGI